MTVAELIYALMKCELDSEVKYFDTFWDREGWGDHALESRWNEVDDIYELDGEVFIR